MGKPSEPGAFPAARLYTALLVSISAMHSKGFLIFSASGIFRVGNLSCFFAICPWLPFPLPFLFATFVCSGASSAARECSVGRAASFNLLAKEPPSNSHFS